AFQRQRYWLEEPKLAVDVAAAGLHQTEHPLLGAVTRLADGDGYLFTSRISLADEPWLADHRVFGTVLLPGTAMVELALAAGEHVGAAHVVELVLAEPLALTDAGARLQLSVEAADGAGQRRFALYGQAGDAADDAPWVQHATGIVAARVASATP